MSDLDDKMREVPDDPKRLRSLLDEMAQHAGLVGLRLSVGYEEGGDRVVLFLTHSLGVEAEKAALQDAVPTLMRCHEDMMVRLTGLRDENADLRSRLDRVATLLVANGCECECECHPDEHGDDCHVCFACKVNEAIGPVSS